MWCKKILVAYDGSAPSHRALEVMREIATQNPAVEVVLVHVMRLFLFRLGRRRHGHCHGGRRHGHTARAGGHRRRHGESDGSEGAQGHLVGRPHRELREGGGLRLIIMGSRGQGGVKGFLGSVSYAVTKESPMTVLIAKEGDCR